MLHGYKDFVSPYHFHICCIIYISMVLENMYIFIALKLKLN